MFDQDGNAEILGVVILIGIFAITAGIISATTLSSPQPVKVPAASIEITNGSDRVLVQHEGGDPLPLDQLSVRIAFRGGPTPTVVPYDQFRDSEVVGSLGRSSPGSGPFQNGDEFSASSTAGNEIAGAALVWTGNDGSVVLSAFGDGLGPLTQAPIDGDHTPGPVYTVRTQPPVPTPTTNWSSNWTFIANFSVNGDEAPVVNAQVDQPLTVLDTSVKGTVNRTVDGVFESLPITIDEYFWTFGDGNTSTLRQPEEPIHYTAPGNYSATLHIRNYEWGLSSTKVVYINVGSSPAGVTFTADPVCGFPNYTYRLTAEPQGFNPTVCYWLLPEGLPPVKKTLNQTNAGTLLVLDQQFGSPVPGQVTVLVSSPYVDGGRNVSYTDSVTYPTAVPAFDTNVTIGAAPLAVQFNDTSTGIVASHLWDFDDGTNSTETNPVHVYIVPGNYTATLKVRSVSCWFETERSINRTIAAMAVINATAGLGGSISPAGLVSVPWGGNCSFNITPATGYHVANVTVDGVSQGAISTYSFTNVTANHTIAASFAIETFTITPTNNNPGMGTITPSTVQTVNYGGNSTFTITPTTGYHIATVLVDGIDQGAITSYQFTNVTANHTIVASFAINTYTITPTNNNPGMGTITPSTVQTVNYGGSSTFTIAPATGYHIANVTVDGASQGAITSYTFPNVITNHTIVASFAINTYTITPTNNNLGMGTITPSTVQTVNYGGNSTFTIAPATGYHIANVTVDGVSQGAIASYPFTNVTANHTIAASFAINTYTITPSWSYSHNHDSISPDTVQTVNYGGNCSFTMNAKSKIVSVSIDDGVEVIKNPPSPYTYKFTGVTAIHTIYVVFSK